MSSNGRRVALVIGNAAYREGGALNNPPNDAEDIAKALTRIGFTGVDSDASKVSASLNLDYAGLREALGAFAQASHGAQQAVLYYAGHGIEYQGENYLLPIDVKLQHAARLEFETASLSQILRTINYDRGLRLIILDACRNNPFRGRLFGARDSTCGLRGIENPPGCILLAYAAKGGTPALDGEGRNSPYVSSLLRHIEKPGVEIVELFREIKSEVLEMTGQAQEPHLYQNIGREKIYLVEPAPTAQPNARPASPIDHETQEYEYWTYIKNETDPVFFEEFLKHFPDGKYRALAVREVGKLIGDCREPEILEKLIDQYPDSGRAAIARQRLSDLANAALRTGPQINSVRKPPAQSPPQDMSPRVVVTHEIAGLPDFAIFRERLRDGAPGPEMVVIPAGTFMMGSDVGDLDLGDNDKAFEDEIVPGQGKRAMRVSKRFALGRYPVTFEEYDAFCSVTKRDLPEDFRWGRGRRPVIEVSWNDAQDFINWLNRAAGLSVDSGYRLPSEAEWEYACRAGTDTRRWWGDSWDPTKANGAGNFEVGRTSPVGKFPPNAWGLYDMIGNVWEWCADVGADNISMLPGDGSAFEKIKKFMGFITDKSYDRVLRGGSWSVDPRLLRSAGRSGVEPDYRYDDVGFRLSRTL